MFGLLSPSSFFFFGQQHHLCIVRELCSQLRSSNPYAREYPKNNKPSRQLVIVRNLLGMVASETHSSRCAFRNVTCHPEELEYAERVR